MHSLVYMFYSIIKPSVSATVLKSTPVHVPTTASTTASTSLSKNVFSETQSSTNPIEGRLDALDSPTFDLQQCAQQFSLEQDDMDNSFDEY